MIDLKKQVELSGRIDKFLREMSDCAKETYLIAFVHVTDKMFGLIEKLGVTHEIFENLESGEKLAFAQVHEFISKVIAMRNEVLGK